jgi:hypothetical protein
MAMVDDRRAESGQVTRMLMAIDRGMIDERALAEQICRACVAGLDVDGAAISLLTTTPTRVTLWSSDPVAELLEELQFTLNEGACIEAATTGRPVLVSDLDHGAEAARWPVFASAVMEQTPVRALFVLPLQWGALNVGVLDLYRVAPGMLDAAQRRDALSAANAAALMLLTIRTDPGEDAWLDRAVGTRVEIHQAIGMVLAQLDVSPQVALARMRGYAFARQRLLIDVARDVLARRVQFTDEMD